MKSENHKTFWVTAKVVMSVTGLNKVDMIMLRRNNPSWWKLNAAGGYLYDLNQIPQSMLKQKHEQAI
jgi:hypothetical protein